MADGIQPLKGSISNLNWFDSLRKHYETPDQIARRFHLRDDPSMRSFCKHAVSISSGGVLQVKRPLPCEINKAWTLMTKKEALVQWLGLESGEISVGTELHLQGGSFWSGEVSSLEFARHFQVERASGGYWKVQLNELSEGSPSRKDLPTDLQGSCEIQITDELSAQQHVDATSSYTREGEEPLIQPGGLGTHWVSLCVTWHLRSSRLQKLIFASCGNLDWPAAAEVNLDIEPLIQCYAKLLVAHHTA